MKNQSTLSQSNNTSGYHRNPGISGLVYFRRYALNGRFNKNIMHIVLLSLILSSTGLVQNSYGTNYYVRTDGSNLNDGSANNPEHAWQTIIYAESQLTGGTHTVHIAAGTYPENVIIDVSGTGTDNRITFIGDGDVYVNRIYIGNAGNTGEADYITLDNLNVGISSEPSTYSIILVNRNSEYAIITGCTIDAHNSIGLEGVSLYGDYGLITESIVQNIDNTYAISVGEGDRRDGGSTNGVIATHNIIRNNKDSDGFRIHGINHTISYNEVRDILKDDFVDRNHGDFVQWFPNDNDCANSPDVRNILIEGNYVHDAECGMWYGNNVCESEGTIVDNIIFRNNVFYQVGIMSQDHGETVTNIKVYNNIFHTVGYMYYAFGTQRTYNNHAISFSSASSGIEVRNNVFLNCGDEPESSTKGWYATNNPTGFTASNNYVGGPGYAAKNTNPALNTYWSEATPPSINGGNPEFVDEANQDYRLMVESPLIDSGMTLFGFNTDRIGTIRPQGFGWDIGAYEYYGPDIIEHYNSIRQNSYLSQNFPNPFSDVTIITVNVPESGYYTLTVYDLTGREIVVLLDEVLISTRHTVEWNGKDPGGRFVEKGIYIYQLRNGDSSIETKKMMRYE